MGRRRASTGAAVRRRLVLDVPTWQVWVASGALVGTGVLVAAGVGAGGYAYGRESASTTEASTTDRIYSADDLRDAASACGTEGDVISGDTLTMPGADYAGYTRQCVVAELDAPPRAVAEYGNSR